MAIPEFPTELPALELAQVIEHNVGGHITLPVAEKAAWWCAGYLFGLGLQDTLLTAPAAGKQPGAAEKLALAASLRDATHDRTGFTIPPWLKAMVAAQLAGYLDEA